MGKIDIFVIFEIKLDNSFPTMQFLINSYTLPHRLDRNGKGGDILVFNVREDIPSKFIQVHFPNKEDFFLEINLREKKWVICSSYNPHNDYISSHIDSMDKTADFRSHNYENLLMISDFNAQEADCSVKDSCDFYSFNHLVKEPTCYKNLVNPKCNDLMLTNRQCSIQTSCIIETGLSDFHKMTHGNCA